MTSGLPRNWHEISVGALWEIFNDQRRRCEAAKSTCDALLCELRAFGIAELAKPDCRRRLSEISSEQIRELIAALMRVRPRYPAITDDLLLKLGGQL